jgi:AcrR family transcriptional regulator
MTTTHRWAAVAAGLGVAVSIGFARPPDTTSASGTRATGASRRGARTPRPASSAVRPIAPTRRTVPVPGRGKRLCHSYPVKYEADWAPIVVDWTSTRGRILLAASELFARRGYFGTSTRDIADAVSIRQPSLFHHFQAKHEIFRTLVRLDLGPSIERMNERLGEQSSWAEKLHLAIACDVQGILAQPFDARGLYQDAVLALDEFEAERDGIAIFHDQVERVIAGGTGAGEFVECEPSFVLRAINGVLFETLREQGGPSGRMRYERPLQAADFGVRSLLVDQARLPGVREVTRARLADLNLSGG